MLSWGVFRYVLDLPVPTPRAPREAMPKTVLGIQIDHSRALAVHLQGGWKGAAVSCVRWVELPGGGADEAGAALLAAGLPHADAAVTALGGDAVFHRIVELPFVDRAKVVQAAPLEAEDSLPLPLEDLVCHSQILERGAGRSRALLAAAPEARVEDLLAALAAGGIQPQVVDVEALALGTVARRCLPGEPLVAALDLGPFVSQVVLVGAEGPFSFHAFSSAHPELPNEVARYLAHWQELGQRAETLYLSGPRAGDADLETWSGTLGIPVRQLPRPSDAITPPSAEDLAWPGWAIALGLALREAGGRGGSRINLLQGAFAPRRESGPWRRRAITGGIYAALLLGLWGAAAWSESAYRESQYQELKTAVREAFRAALPDVTNIVSERDQMRARVDELEARAASLGSLVDREVSPLRILREISARVPGDLKVEFRDFTVEEGRVRVEGETTSFDAIDKIKADLAQYPRFATVTVSDARVGVSDQVLFKLTITLGKEG